MNVRLSFLILTVLATFIILLSFKTKESVALKPSENATKEIIVLSPEYPYDSKLWKKEMKKISKQFHDVSIKNNHKIFTALIETPIDDYEKLVKTLKSKGMKVYDNKPLKISLHESKDAIGTHQTYLPSGNLIPHLLTGQGVNIAILDTGIDPQHSDFSGKIISFWDFAGDVNGDTHNDHIYDDHGHGTHVAGIAAGSGSADDDFAGVAPDADLIVGKVCKCVNPACKGMFALDCPPSSIADGITWAVDEGTDMIGLSLGVQEKTWCEDGGPLQNAIQYAVENDVVVVATVGNSGPWPDTIDYPGCLQDVIAVGASAKKDYTSPYQHGKVIYWPPVCMFENECEGVPSTTLRINVQGQQGGSSFSDTLEVSGYSYRPSGFHLIYQIDPGTALDFQIQTKWKKWTCLGGSEEGWDNLWGGNAGSVVDYVIIEVYGYPKESSSFCYWGLKYESSETLWMNFLWTSSHSGKDIVIPFSSRDQSQTGFVTPDITAPGDYICSANLTERYDTEIGYEVYQKMTPEGSCGNNYYIPVSGTSMAVPHVIGAMALLKEDKPGATFTKIKNAIINNGDPFFFGGVWAEGKGRLNVSRSLNDIGYHSPEGWLCFTSSDCDSGLICDNGRCVKCNSNHVQTTNAGSGYNRCESADLGTHCTSGNRGSYCTAESFCDEKSPNTKLWGDCSSGDEHTVDKCDSTCKRVDTNTCDSSCGALLQCDSETKGMILENVCSYGNSRTKDECCKDDTRICDAQCGADARCNDVETGEQGSCPEDQSCNPNCQCDISQPEGGGGGGSPPMFHVPGTW